MSIFRRLMDSEKTRSRLEVLYDGKEFERIRRQLVRKKIKIFSVVIVVTFLMAIAVGSIESREYDTILESISRNGYGKGDKVLTLVANYEADIGEEKIPVVVAERKYSDAEIEEYAGKIEEVLNSKILGDNQSLENVRSDLNLITHLDEFPFTVSWKTEDPSLINDRGIINHSNVRKKLRETEGGGLPLRLCATIKYEEYVQDIYFYIVLNTFEGMTKEILAEDTLEAIKKLGEEGKSDDKAVLPKEVDGIKVSFRKSKNNTFTVILPIGFICALGLIIGKDKEIEKEFEKRNEEIDKDYSRIVSQYALYYCAGMNHRKIWAEICNRYEKKIMSGEKKRYAYEEMLRTRNQLEDGAGEFNAYEEFATRCNNPKYRAFVNLIEQSVKRGNENLYEILDEEVERCRREENNRIRMEIQELSTKLLLPMILLLLVVIVIVIVPAFMSFK